MSQISVVADYGDRCGECPVWNRDEETLEWTDCVGQKFLRLEWPSGRHSIVNRAVVIYGFRRNRQGGYVITNDQGIWLWDGAGSPILIAAQADGSPCQVNDCVADSRGRLFTGSYFYNPAGEYELGKLIRVETDGRTSIVDEGFHLANGMGFSPDETKLYVTDSVARRIYAYDYEITTGSVSARQIFVQVPGDEGVPDGLVVDAEGFVWSAQWYGSCIVRYSPDGQMERRLPIPAKQTSSLAFGGPELTDIFITSAGQAESMPVMPPGYDPTSGNVGGALYHVNLGIQGQQQYSADIAITAAARSKS